MRRKFIALGIFAIAGIATLVGCAINVKAPEEKPNTHESVVQENTTITEVEPTDVGEEFPF